MAGRTELIQINGKWSRNPDVKGSWDDFACQPLDDGDVGDWDDW